MQCYARYPDESWSSSFLRSRPPLDTTLSPCFGVPPPPAPTSHSGRRPPHDCKLDNPGLGWFPRRLGIAAPLGATTQTSHWVPTSRRSGAIPRKPSYGVVPVGAPGHLHTSRGPPPLPHLWSTRNTPPPTGPFTKFTSPPFRVIAGPASRRPPPLLPQRLL
ncbi:hypothetical protein HPB50_025952 [Hyalomma asiaticum]|uniref:Uncharacterized protein n=1 Tax=Hyalomma asiaticum TaxID=266040 RepID=A0ACB7S310_HYAAI|nr:hypothetical protein HPB50_025952 [Hyalomma asiaticum]